MANRSKASGTRFESRIRDEANAWAGETVCERVVLHGSRDHGDVRARVDDLTLTIEAKYRKRYPADGDMESFKAQAVTENENAGQDGAVLIVNVPNRSVMRAQCWMLRSTLMRLHGIDRLLGDVPKPMRGLMWNALMVDGEHDWLCVTFETFLHICWGDRRTDDFQ